MRKALGRLQRKAVDQVHIDAVEAKPPRSHNEIARHFERLDAVNDFLHLGVKILYAHAQSIEAEAAERLEVRLRRDARVDLDADFRVGREGEALRGITEELLHLLGS